MNDAELRADLRNRLLKIKKGFANLSGECRLLRKCDIPLRLREEVIKLYDEFGGLEILSKITNIGHNTIKLWHKEYYQNPQRFYTIKGRRPKKNKITRLSFVNNILTSDRNQEPEPDEEAESEASYAEMTRNLPADAVVEIKKVGELLLEKNSRGIGIDDEVR